MRFDTCITLLSLLALSPLSVLGAPAPVPQEGAATSAAASGSGSGTCSRRQGGRPGGGRGGLNRDRPTESPASNAGDTSAVSPTSTSTPAADAETTAEAEGTTEVVQSSAADSAAAPEVTIADTQHLATAGLTPAGFGSGSGGGEGQGQPGSGSGSGGGEGQGQPEGGNNDAGGDQGQASGTYSPLSQAPAQTQAAPPAESAAGGGEGEGSDSGSGSGSASGGFEQDILQAHNDYRAKFNAGPMTWNTTMAQMARDHYEASGCVMEHSGMPPGENLSSTTNVDLTMKMWGPDEEPLWNKGDDYVPGAGHFTQLVWQGSNSLGCAAVDCGGMQITACEYYPRGNMLGDFANNVGKT